MHELLGQKLAHAGAQHGATIGPAAVGRGAAALELHLPAVALEQALDHGNGPAIAIAIAGAKRALLDIFRAVDREGIAGCPAPGPHRLARHADIAGKEAAELVVLGQPIAEAQLVEQAWAVGDILGRWNRRGGDRHVMAGEHLAGPVIVAIGGGLGIRLERLQQ